MNKLQKKKLCWNCESQVSIEEETCPICGVSVVPAYLEGTGANFSPPYSMGAGTDFGIPRSPYETDASNSSLESEISEKKIEEGQPALDEFKRVMITVILLLTGSVFFIFSLALALFSRHGVFTLQWDGSYWFIYTLFAIPLLIIGWRSLMRLDDV